MRAVPSNQIADILHFNDNPKYIVSIYDLTVFFKKREEDFSSTSEKVTSLRLFLFKNKNCAKPKMR